MCLFYARIMLALFAILLGGFSVVYFQTSNPRIMQYGVKGNLVAVKIFILERILWI